MSGLTREVVEKACGLQTNHPRWQTIDRLGMFTLPPT
jgi:hypothetical protein